VIVHLVLFTPKPSLPASARAALADAVAMAVREIPVIRRVRVGARVTHGRPYEQLMRVNYEYAAMLEFDDLSGLVAYLEHPAHEALAERFFESFEEALMYDYELKDGAAAVAGLL
jgi:hypothetical protein